MPRSVVVFVVLLGALTFACSQDDEDNGHDDDHHHGGEGGEEGSDPEGTRMCCSISAICHDVSAPSSSEIAECHVLGHTNDPAACRSAYDGCLAACEGLNDDPVEHGCE